MEDALRDAQLMARLQSGDEDALTALIDLHRPWALRYAARLLGDPMEAEDAVQEAFARLYLLRDRFDPAFRLTVWLRVLLRSICLDVLRRRRQTPIPSPLPEEASDSASPEALLLQKERRLALWRALSGLSEADRRLLTGFALEGLSYRELAAQTGLSLPQVRIRLHRIRAKLRRKEDETT